MVWLSGCTLALRPTDRQCEAHDNDNFSEFPSSILGGHPPRYRGIWTNRGHAIGSFPA